MKVIGFSLLIGSGAFLCGAELSSSSSTAVSSASSGPDSSDGVRSKLVRRADVDSGELSQFVASLGSGVGSLDQTVVSGSEQLSLYASEVVARESRSVARVVSTNVLGNMPCQGCPDSSKPDGHLPKHVTSEREAAGPGWFWRCCCIASRRVAHD